MRSFDVLNFSIEVFDAFNCAATASAMADLSTAKACGEVSAATVHTTAKRIF
ncbi:hypothetical protein P4S72_01200 [Vibrio sp. PP-XX7]